LLFTDRTDWPDEQIVLAYRAQHHIEADFRRLKDPHYLTFRPTFHWTDQKLRVHAFYCVLALLLLNLLRRKLAKAGIPLSVVEMMDTLTDIYEVTLLYPRRIWLQEALRANRPRGHGPGAAQNRREPRPRALSQRVGHTTLHQARPRQ